jgi:hypothetical protein
MAMLRRAAGLGLPHWYVGGGAVAQTVWNALTGRDPLHGIRDFDLVYHDRTDLSWAAEDAVIRRGAEVFAGLPVEVEIRNQARVHLWYPERFGLPCPPVERTEDAIDRFPSIATAVGVRHEPAGGWTVHARHGIDDIFALLVRPNPVLCPRWVYEAKVERWLGSWPELTVEPWPEP